MKLQQELGNRKRKSGVSARKATKGSVVAAIGSRPTKLFEAGRGRRSVGRQK